MCIVDGDSRGKIVQAVGKNSSGSGDFVVDRAGILW
jgi:hypothetical protein